MEIAVEENFDAGIGPVAKPARKRRAGYDRRLAPVVRDDQHGEPLADVGREQVEKLVDLAFEAWRYVVNRCKQQALRTESA